MIAIKPISNFGGIVILDIDGDYVVSAEDYGNGLLRKATAKVRYNAKGDAYFMRQGRREYISEFMRVEEMQMTTPELGKKLYEFATHFDPYGVFDNEYTEEKAIADVSDLKSAQLIIGYLLEILMEM